MQPHDVCYMCSSLIASVDHQQARAHLDAGTQLYLRMHAYSVERPSPRQIVKHWCLATEDDAEGKAEAGSEAWAEAEAEAGCDSWALAEAEAGSEAGAEAEAGSEAEAEAEAGAEARAEAGAEAGAGAEATAEAGAIDSAA